MAAIMLSSAGVSVYLAYGYFFVSSSNDVEGICKNDGNGRRWQQQRSLLSDKAQCDAEILITLYIVLTGIENTLRVQADAPVQRLREIVSSYRGLRGEIELRSDRGTYAEGFFRFQDKILQDDQILNDCGIEQGSVVEYHPLDDYDQQAWLVAVRWLTHPLDARGFMKVLRARHSVVLMQYRSLGLNRVVSVEKWGDVHVSNRVMCTGFSLPQGTSCDLDAMQAKLFADRRVPIKNRLEAEVPRGRLYDRKWEDHRNNVLSTVPAKLPYNQLHSNCHHYAESIWYMIFLELTRMPNDWLIAKLMPPPLIKLPGRGWFNEMMEFPCRLFDQVAIDLIDVWNPEPEVYLRSYRLGDNRKDPYAPHHIKATGSCEWMKTSGGTDTA